MKSHQDLLHTESYVGLGKGVMLYQANLNHFSFVCGHSSMGLNWAYIGVACPIVLFNRYKLHICKPCSNQHKSVYTQSQKGLSLISAVSHLS